MRKNKKIKETPKRFYACDMQQECNKSDKCGKECRHTLKYSYRVYKDIKEKDRKWIHMNNGDVFEKIVKDKEDLELPEGVEYNEIS